MILRDSKYRTLIVIIVVLATSAVLLLATPTNLRQEALKALQAATFLFAICTAISLALFTNYVKGLRESYLKRLFDIRLALEKFYDEYKGTQDMDVRRLLDTYIVPLLSLNTQQWMNFDPHVKEILPNVGEPALAIHAREPAFIARYLLRIEDETNELGILYIRRIFTSLHLEVISGAFVLVAVGIGALGFSYLLPSGFVGDFLVANVASAIITFAVIELLLLVTFLQQEGQGEEPLIDDEEEGAHQLGSASQYS